MGSFDAYRHLPPDETRGNPLHAWGPLHANKLGTYWTVTVDLPLSELTSLRPVVQSKARLASVLSAHRAGTPLPAIELGIFPDGSAWIVDGNHRLIAARRGRQPTIPVTFTFVETLRSSPHPAKKSPAQLSREIAEVLARSRARRT